MPGSDKSEEDSIYLLQPPFRPSLHLIGLVRCFGLLERGKMALDGAPQEVTSGSRMLWEILSKPWSTCLGRTEDPVRWRLGLQEELGWKRTWIFGQVWKKLKAALFHRNIPVRGAVEKKDFGWNTEDLET